MTEVMSINLREGERLGHSMIFSEGGELNISAEGYVLEVWPILKELPGEAQVMGYIIRMVK